MEKLPVMNSETVNSILDDISEKAQSYTPEWRFDMEHPDVGTALAMVFADMHHRTLHQYNQTIYKYRNEFFNCLHAGLKPSVPASGYVTFGLVNQGAPGAELLAGTALVTEQTGKDGERIPVETLEDVYVSPVVINKIYESYDGLDYIGMLYDQEKEKKPFSLFGFRGENLQAHEFYLGHPWVFALEGDGTIELIFLGRNRVDVSLDLEQVRFSYSSEDGFVDFEGQSLQGGGICLKKGKNQPPVHMQEREGINCCWIRCLVLRYEALKTFSFHETYLKSSRRSIMPDSVYAGGIDSTSQLCFPFGEQFTIFNEVYLSSKEALSKPGALIHLSFDLSFVKVPLDYGDMQTMTDWKLVMKRNAVQVDKEYDITIEQVIWEYFNGNGWIRLFPMREYEECFGVQNGTQQNRKVITFFCPADLTPALVGGIESNYIRIRILKVNHAYKTKGQYISPLMEHISFQYQYMGDGVYPEWLQCVNNGETQMFAAKECLNRVESFFPIKQTGDVVPTIYIGTEQPFLEGPLRLLWVFENCRGEKKPTLVWEYYAGGRFMEMNLADETEHFKKTGLVTFTGNEAGEKKKLFGEVLYWIRIRDQAGAYGSESRERCPLVSGVYENGVGVHTVRSDYEEYFTMNQYMESYQCQLLYKNIFACQVWTKEQDVFSLKEKEVLKEEHRLRQVYEADGSLRETWVLWQQKESLAESAPGNFSYILDSIEGRILFGDNRHGRIPKPGIPDGIHVIYSVGGGWETNLAAGSVAKLDRAIGFVNQVQNPLPLSGGYDTECVEEAVIRCAGEIKHCFRAITTRDFEYLAREASGNIEKAVCFSGYLASGEKEYGHVSLVLLQKDYRSGENSFLELSETVYEYLKSWVSPGLITEDKLHVIRPLFVTIQIGVEVFVSDFSQLFRCKKTLMEGLERFIDPVLGNFNGKGFRVGTLPRYHQLQTVIKDIEGIKYLKNLNISCFLEQENHVHEMTLEAALNYPFVLPRNGIHKVMMRIG